MLRQIHPFPGSGPEVVSQPSVEKLSRVATAHLFESLAKVGVVCESVEETLNGLLDAEHDYLAVTKAGLTAGGVLR